MTKSYDWKGLYEYLNDFFVLGLAGYGGRMPPKKSISQLELIAHIAERFNVNKHQAWCKVQEMLKFHPEHYKAQWVDPKPMSLETSNARRKRKWIVYTR